MRIKYAHGAAGLYLEGKTLAPDEDGYFDVPFELAQPLLNQPDWIAEEPREVGSTDPYSPLFVEPAEEEPELTPAQKAARTRAANEAAKAAQAK